VQQQGQLPHPNAARTKTRRKDGAPSGALSCMGLCSLYFGFGKLGFLGLRFAWGWILFFVFVGEARVQALKLFAPVDGLVYVMHVVAPAFAHFHEEFQEDFDTEDAFDLLTGAGSDVFQHAALLANNDGFLAVAFYKNYG